MLARRSSPFQPHHDLQVLVESLLVATSEEFLCFGKVLSKKACAPLATASRRFAHVILSVFHKDLSRGRARKQEVSHIFPRGPWILKAADVSVDSKHTRSWWRRGGGTAATASRRVVAKNSAHIMCAAATASRRGVAKNSAHIMRAAGPSGLVRVETTLATTRCRHFPSDMQKLPSNCRRLGDYSTCLRCKMTTEADHRLYNVPWLGAEAFGGP